MEKFNDVSSELDLQDLWDLVHKGEEGSYFVDPSQICSGGHKKKHCIENDLRLGIDTILQYLF